MNTLWSGLVGLGTIITPLCLSGMHEQPWQVVNWERQTDNHTQSEYWVVPAATLAACKTLEVQKEMNGAVGTFATPYELGSAVNPARVNNLFAILHPLADHDSATVTEQNIVDTATLANYLDAPVLRDRVFDTLIERLSSSQLSKQLMRKGTYGLDLHEDMRAQLQQRWFNNSAACWYARLHLLNSSHRETLQWRNPEGVYASVRFNQSSDRIISYAQPTHTTYERTLSGDVNVLAEQVPVFDRDGSVESIIPLPKWCINPEREKGGWTTSAGSYTKVYAHPNKPQLLYVTRDMLAIVCKKTGIIQAHMPVSKKVHANYNHDGSHIIVRRRQSLDVHDDTLTLIRSLMVDAPIGIVALSRGNYSALGTVLNQNKKIKLYDIETGLELSSDSLYGEYVHALRFSNDNTLLYALLSSIPKGVGIDSTYSTIVKYGLPEMHRLKSCVTYERDLRDMRLNQTGSVILAPDKKATCIRCFDTENVVEIGALKWIDDDGPCRLRMSKDESLLASLIFAQLKKKILQLSEHDYLYKRMTCDQIGVLMRAYNKLVKHDLIRFKSSLPLLKKYPEAQKTVQTLPTAFVDCFT